MREEKESVTESLEAGQDFPQFLKQVRKEENVLLEQLSDGIMTVSQLARIEKGQRPVFKNMRDRLLGRLGIASDLYENLLNIEDYEAWEQQRNILCAVEEKAVQRAQELLAAYEKQKPNPMKDKIKRQFCLVMQAEILKQQNAPPHEIGKCYERAVKLTVPDVEYLCIESKLLSIQEVNMILEYEFYRKSDNFAEKCKGMMKFVENSLYDDLSKVKIYPKIAYFYLREIFSDQSGRTLKKLDEGLTICNQAIEMLRDTGRAYYLLELLDMKIELAECIEKVDKERGKVQESESLKSACQESKELADLLRKLYAEYQVSAYMQDCTYLYRQRWVFYIGDVLRIRRKMYGITQQKLCEGVCSVKTLRRAEKMQSNMQHTVLGALLNRLGISKEYQRISLVTNDGEVVKLSAELAVCRNNFEIEKTRELLKQIKDRVSTEIPENRQYFMELETSLDWIEGKITKEEFAKREKEALQCTLNTRNLFDTNEIYLTEMEMSCIRKMIQGVEQSEKRKYIEFLLHFFECYEKKCKLSDCVVMYEYVMTYIASELGNMGEYCLATEVNKRVLRESLMCRRVWEISNNLYNILWNESEQNIIKGEHAGKEKMTEGLTQCIILSHFCKQSYREKFFCDKIR